MPQNVVLSDYKPKTVNPPITIKALCPGAVVLLVLLTLHGCTPGEHDADETILVFGGTILTMDEDQPEAEAMVIRGERIEVLGNRADLELLFPNTRRHDLQGRVALPGIVDSHTHVHELGHDRNKADLHDVASVGAMVERLQARYPNPQPGQWLVGAGWDEGQWASRGYPDRDTLDAAFPDNPVALESLHGFAGFYNGQALAAAGVDAETLDPEGGTILRRADGSPTGVMLTLAQGLVTRHIPPETLDEAKEAILLGLDALAEVGVTSVHEAGIDPLLIRAFSELADEGRLPIRIYGLLDGNNDSLMTAWFKMGPFIDPEAFFTVRSIKVFYDGSLGSRTALLREPYSDDPGAANPIERIAPEAVASLAQRAVANGFQMAVHAIGDEGNDRTLNVFEEALAGYPGLDHRWRIEHAQVVLPDYYERAARLGVISSVQSSHAVGDSPWAEARVGPERIRHAYAWRRILDGGGSLIVNADLPGEPWEPVQTLYFAVTRKTLDGQPPEGWYADQALTVEEALRAMTWAGAHAAFQEDQLGTFAPGYFADFIELDRDPRHVPPDSLKDLKVVRTWVAGRVWGDDSESE